MDYIKLKVWQNSRKLVNTIYEITGFFPKEEIFGMTNQMRRAAISIASNIAEGCGRRSFKETLQFLYVSRGSLFELETQSYIALDRKYISESELEGLILEIQDCKKLLNGFINYYRNSKC